MKIQRCDGIREAYRNNEYVLFNTYTYEKIILKNTACEIWKQVSDEKVISYNKNNIDKNTERIVLFLYKKGYISISDI